MVAKTDAQEPSKWLFWTCFASLVTTSFGFIIRGFVIGDWGTEFLLTETQKGELLGVGLWPFALSIILLSLIIDKIGYDKALWFAFGCHVVSAIVTISANGYTMLWWGTFILALGNGAVEAVINPVVATVYQKEKTKWLNILHAGWPGGMVLGGVLILMLIPQVHWKWKVGLVLIPTILYGVMMLRAKFPVHERVKAGVPYKEMLQEIGAIGVLIVSWIAIAAIFKMTLVMALIPAFILAIVFWFYVKAWGSPLFIVMLLIMIPLATTELGTDSWITELVNPVMAKVGISGGWVLIYTAFLMMVLRFFAGPIVERLQPLGLLAACSAIAVVGLVLLSKTAGLVIFVAATIYAVGKSFFWPTMLGVVAERFPKGGALTLNGIAGMGMLSVGVIGTVWLGNIQDKSVDSYLENNSPAIHQQVVVDEKVSLFGKYKTINPEAYNTMSDENKLVIEDSKTVAKKNALMTVAIFPLIMLISYIILILYFRSKGGYKVIELEAQE